MSEYQLTLIMSCHVGWAAVLAAAAFFAAGFALGAALGAASLEAGAALVRGIVDSGKGKGLGGRRKWAVGLIGGRTTPMRPRIYTLRGLART